MVYYTLEVDGTPIDFENITINKAHPSPDPDTWEAEIKPTISVTKGSTVNIKREGVVYFTGLLEEIEKAAGKKRTTTISGRHISVLLWRKWNERNEDPKAGGFWLNYYVDKVAKFYLHQCESDEVAVGVQHRIGWGLRPDSWIPTAIATESGTSVNYIKDRLNVATWWSLGRNQALGDWFKVDLTTAKSVTGIRVENRRNNEYVRHYKIQYSTDNINWNDISGASGNNDHTLSYCNIVEAFTPITARYWRIYCTENYASDWSITQIYIYTGTADISGISLGTLDTGGFLNDQALDFTWGRRSETLYKLAESMVTANLPWEYWVTNAGAMNLRIRRGSDKSASIEFRYSSEFADIKYKESYIDRADRVRVLGKGSGHDQDLTSSDWQGSGDYELVVADKQAENKTEANIKALSVLEEQATEIISIKCIIEDDPYTTGDWDIGDDVTLTDYFTGASGSYRIKKMQIKYDNNGEVITLEAGFRWLEINDILKKKFDQLDEMRMTSVYDSMMAEGNPELISRDSVDFASLDYTIYKEGLLYNVLDSSNKKLYSASDFGTAFNWVTTNDPAVDYIDVLNTGDPYLCATELNFINNLYVHGHNTTIQLSAVQTRLVDMQEIYKCTLDGFKLDLDGKGDYGVDMERTTNFSSEIEVKNCVIWGYVEAGIKTTRSEDVAITDTKCYGWLSEAENTCLGKYGIMTGDPLDDTKKTMGIIKLNRVTSTRNTITDLFIKNVLVVEMKDILLTTKNDWAGAAAFIANIVLSTKYTGLYDGGDVIINGGWIEGKGTPQIKIGYTASDDQAKKLEIYGAHIANESTGAQTDNAIIFSGNETIKSFIMKGGELKCWNTNAVYQLWIDADNIYIEGVQKTNGAGINKVNWADTIYWVRWLDDKVYDSNETPTEYNFSFEYPDSAFSYPSAWYRNVYAGSGTWTHDTSTVIDGKYSLKITNTTAASRCSTYTDYAAMGRIPVIAGRKYLLSCYAKTSNVSYAARLLALLYDKNGTFIESFETSTTSTNWTRINKQFTPSSTSVQLIIECATAVGAYSAWFDKVVLIEIKAGSEGTSFPTNPMIGDIFYHTSYQQSFRYDPDSVEPNVGGWVALTRVMHKGTTVQRLAASVATGDIWYDTDTNGMYQWDGSAWVYISTSEGVTPLTNAQENLLSNANFESDSDGDSVPDGWDVYTEVGSVTKSLYADSYKGKYCINLIPASVSSIGGIASQYLPAQGSKLYYFEGYVKCEIAGNGDVWIGVYEYNASKVYITAHNLLYNVSGLTSWTKYSVSFTSDVNCRYLRVYLCAHTPSTSLKCVRFSAITLSEQRATIKTSTAVAAGSTIYTNTDECPNNDWTATGTTFTIPNTDHEYYCINITSHLQETLAGNLGLALRIRLTSGVTNEDYPSSSWGYCPYVICPSGMQSAHTVMIMIPANRKGWTARVYVYVDYIVDGNYTVKTYANGYGFSPHVHQ